QVEVRLEVRDQRVLLQDGEPFGVGDRVGRNVEQRAISQSGESNQKTPLLRLLALWIEPDSDFNRVGNLLADGVQVLVPRNLFTRQQQFARARPELVVSLSDSPLHQLRAPIDEVVYGRRARATVGGTGVHRLGIIVQNQVCDGMMHNLAALESGRPNLDQLRPARL